jgi:hypothetical protein
VFETSTLLFCTVKYVKDPVAPVIPEGADTCPVNVDVPDTTALPEAAIAVNDPVAPVIPEGADTCPVNVDVPDTTALPEAAIAVNDPVAPVIPEGADTRSVNVEVPDTTRLLKEPVEPVIPAGAAKDVDTLKLPPILVNETDILYNIYTLYFFVKRLGPRISSLCKWTISLFLIYTRPRMNGVVV